MIYRMATSSGLALAQPDKERKLLPFSEDDMADQWFILRDDRKYGPYSSAQMKQMAEGGQLLPSDMVQEEGTAQWLSAVQVGAFFPSTGSVPPPPPAPGRRTSGASAKPLIYPAFAMLFVSGLAAVISVVGVLAPNDRAGKKILFALSLIHNGVAVYATVQLLKLRQYPVALTSTVLAGTSWVWLLLAMLPAGFFILGMLVAASVGVWGFTSMRHPQVLALFREPEGAKTPLDELLENKRLIFMAIGGFVFFVLLVGLIGSEVHEGLIIGILSWGILGLIAIWVLTRSPQAKLIGRWDFTTSDNQPAVVEFHKNGNFTIERPGQCSLPLYGSTGKTLHGRWKMAEADTVELVMEGGRFVEKIIALPTWDKPNQLRMTLDGEARSLTLPTLGSVVGKGVGSLFAPAPAHERIVGRWEPVNTEDWPVEFMDNGVVVIGSEVATTYKWLSDHEILVGPEEGGRETSPFRFSS